MAISGYYYEVGREADLPRLVRAFERSLARMGGSPLTPVSSVGAVIDLVSYKDAMQANGAALEKLERSTGARKESIDEQRMLALVVARQQADVPKRESPRIARRGPAGTGGPYDWHLLETRTVAAWKLFDDARGGISWGGIRVGQIDTGYTEHVALGFSGATSRWVDTLHDYNYMAGHAAGFADPGSDFPFNERAEVAIDPLGGLNGGHGTKTNSVLCGYDDAIGYRGAAPQVPMVPIRLTDSVWLDAVLANDLPDAIVRHVDTSGARLITLSMGAPHPWPILSPVKFPIPKALRDAIDYAYERGVFFFCAAGNNIPNPDVVNPARLNRTIAVAGTTRDKWPWSGSSRGTQVEISAPADQIHRAERLRNGKDAYGVGDGTSYATPQVCAAAALWLAWHGEAIAAAYAAPWQPIEAFRALLAASGARACSTPRRCSSRRFRRRIRCANPRPPERRQRKFAELLHAPWNRTCA